MSTQPLLFGFPPTCDYMIGDKASGLRPCGQPSVVWTKPHDNSVKLLPMCEQHAMEAEQSGDYDIIAAVSRRKG